MATPMAAFLVVHLRICSVQAKAAVGVPVSPEAKELARRHGMNPPYSRIG